MHAFATLTVPPQAIGIHWFGQSSYALKDAEGHILQIDPYFPHARPPERYIHAAPPLDEATLPTEFVLLTHDHSDHTHPESLARIYAAWPNCRFIGPVESIEKMRATGLEKASLSVIQAGESQTFGSITVHAVWAKPPQGAPEDGINPPDVTHLGYVIEMGGVRVYISGDPINTFADHDELIAPIAALRPHIGFLTTHPTEGEFPFFDGSARMAQKIGLHTAVPSHYQCFVKRNYDPQAWVAAFPPDTPNLLIIPYNRSVIYHKP